MEECFAGERARQGSRRIIGGLGCWPVYWVVVVAMEEKGSIGHVHGVSVSSDHFKRSFAALHLPSQTLRFVGDRVQSLFQLTPCR